MTDHLHATIEKAVNEACAEHGFLIDDLIGIVKVVNAETGAPELHPIAFGSTSTGHVNVVAGLGLHRLLGEWLDQYAAACVIGWHEDDEDDED